MGFFVTTPIFYVNAAPHLGHAYTSIAADVLARHHRQRGEDVFFLTGTDEHGEPVATAAEAQGTTPQALADKNAERFLALREPLDLSNDFFIRTTDERHKVAVQDVLQRVHANGFTYKARYEGWYCVRCADFKTETELVPGDPPTCPIHEIALEREGEENWFFALSQFQDRLEQLYAERPDFVGPQVRANEALSFIQGGLQDVSLSRNKAKLTWGVTVPWDEDHVFYVWFDALLNYWTALTFADPGGRDLTATHWPAELQVIGKDILKFHAIYWPALLLAAGLEPPRKLYVHGYLLVDDKKMSKSRGNVLDPFELIEEYGVDALRFYLFREVPFGQDGSVSREGFDTRYTTELANDYGNLASRSLAMLSRYRDGVVPDAEVGLDLTSVAPAVCALLDRAELSGALEETWKTVRRLNQYVEEQAPWALAKDPEKAAELDVALRTLAEGLRVVTVLLHAYLPGSTAKVLAALGDQPAALDAPPIAPGTQTAKLAPLFPKRERAAA